jgi:hypothetical protein
MILYPLTEYQSTKASTYQHKISLCPPKAPVPISLYRCAFFRVTTSIAVKQRKLNQESRKGIPRLYSNVEMTTGYYFWGWRLLHGERRSIGVVC